MGFLNWIFMNLINFFTSIKSLFFNIIFSLCDQYSEEKEINNEIRAEIEFIQFFRISFLLIQSSRFLCIYPSHIYRQWTWQ